LDDKEEGEDEEEMQETPLKMVWKKNGRIYHAKKAQGSFDPYLGGNKDQAKPRTER